MRAGHRKSWREKLPDCGKELTWPDENRYYLLPHLWWIRSRSDRAGAAAGSARTSGSLHHVRLAISAAGLRGAGVLPPGRDPDGPLSALRSLSVYPGARL